jgi:hypothetical protein
MAGPSLAPDGDGTGGELTVAALPADLHKLLSHRRGNLDAYITLTRDERLEVVSAEIHQFLLRTEEQRYALHQDFIRCVVRRTSPILVDFARAQGLDLGHCMELIQPPEHWPSRLDTPTSPISRHALLRDDRKGYSFSGSHQDDAFRSRFRRAGAVLRLPSHPDGRFGVRASGNALEACFDLGPVRLVLDGCGRGWMRLPPGIPETLLDACVGRTVDRVVSHPLFDDRDLLIRRVGYASMVSAAPVITFRDDITDIDFGNAILERI